MTMINKISLDVNSLDDNSIKLVITISLRSGRGLVLDPSSWACKLRKGVCEVIDEKRSVSGGLPLRTVIKLNMLKISAQLNIHKYQALINNNRSRISVYLFTTDFLVNVKTKTRRLTTFTYCRDYWLLQPALKVKSGVQFS